MTNDEIYRKAIPELWQKTYGRMEHDEKQAIELFDKLLDRGIESHCDTVKELCREAGYDEYASEKIGHIYDVISLYKAHQESSMVYWDINELLSD